MGFSPLLENGLLKLIDASTQVDAQPSGRKFTPHRKLEPSLKDPQTGKKRSEVVLLPLYVTYIIQTVLDWEQTIVGFSDMNLFSGVDRSDLEVPGELETSRGIIEAAIRSVYENSFKAPVGKKVNLGLSGIRNHFRTCRRILDFLAEKKLPLAAIHIQAAISNVAELTGASKGWKGSAVSTSLAWLGKACASEELERFARRSEIAQFVHGGIASVLTKSKPTAHAPWPGDHVLMSVEDLCHDANDEVAIAAAQSHLSYVGVRLGNTLLAYAIEIQDAALDESKDDICPDYPPCRHPLPDPESAMVRHFEMPRAIVHLTHTKGSGGPAETAEIHVPLIDSRRRSLLRAYSLWRDRIAAIRAAGIEASALKKDKAAEKMFTDAVGKMDGTPKKPGVAPLDAAVTPIDAAIREEHQTKLLAFLAAPPAEPYEEAEERDLIRRFRAMARISKIDERMKADDTRSPHAKYPVRKLTGHSCRRFFNTVLGLADVSQTDINLTMDWAGARESRMSTNYNANKQGRVMLTRLRGVMLIGAQSFTCPLPDQPYDVHWTFPGYKDWFFQYMDPERLGATRGGAIRQGFRARVRARVAAIQEGTSMGAEGGSPQSHLDDEDINEHSKGFTPDMKALPTRSTGRYDSRRERDPAALAQMLPEKPTDEERDAVAFQAWTDAAIHPFSHGGGQHPMQLDHLRRQLDEDSQQDLPEAQDAPTK